MVRQLYFPDFSIGKKFELGPHAVSAPDIVAFARKFDPQPFHLDDDAARMSLLGGLAASGWHTSAILMRLICDAFLLDTASLGSNGIDELKWLKPVLAGDVLSGVCEVRDKRISSRKPDVGIISFSAGLCNQQTVEKIRMTGIFFVRVSPS